MPVHKFGRKPERRVLRRQPLTVYWKPNMDLKHPAQKKTPETWEIYTQEKLNIPANGSKTIMLGFGVMMTRGMVLTSLKQEMVYKRCSLQNGTLLESVDDIVITIQNNSDFTVTINEGIPLCYVHYIK